MKLLFIDDERFPADDRTRRQKFFDWLFCRQSKNSWTIVRSYDEAIKFLAALDQAPNFVSFDNDLGPDSKEGCKVADWMIERDLDLGGKWIPADFSFYVHSQNSVRRDYINATLNRYLEYRSHL